MKRQLFIVGNWKMHKSAAETAEMIGALRQEVAGVTNVRVALCPSFLSLATARSAASGSSIEIGAQNVHFAAQGAYTGEISPAQLLDAGCKLAIIGHSERRQFFGETDETVNKRTVAALAAGITPITCIGETLQERQSGTTETVLDRQLTLGLQGISAADIQRVVLAYEPVWAIGTGLTASPEQAQEAHAFIRRRLAELFGQSAADAVIIQYGGSVKASNVVELMSCPDIDGALVGGASLKADEFGLLIRNASAASR